MTTSITASWPICVTRWPSYVLQGLTATALHLRLDSQPRQAWRLQTSTKHMEIRPARPRRGRFLSVAGSARATLPFTTAKESRFTLNWPQVSKRLEPLKRATQHASPSDASFQIIEKTSKKHQKKHQKHREKRSLVFMPFTPHPSKESSFKRTPRPSARISRASHACRGSSPSLQRLFVDSNVLKNHGKPWTNRKKHEKIRQKPWGNHVFL